MSRNMLLCLWLCAAKCFKNFWADLQSVDGAKKKKKQCLYNRSHFLPFITRGKDEPYCVYVRLPSHFLVSYCYSTITTAVVVCLFPVSLSFSVCWVGSQACRSRENTLDGWWPRHVRCSAMFLWKGPHGPCQLMDAMRWGYISGFSETMRKLILLKSFKVNDNEKLKNLDLPQMEAPADVSELKEVSWEWR